MWGDLWDALSFPVLSRFQQNFRSVRGSNYGEGVRLLYFNKNVIFIVKQPFFKAAYAVISAFSKVQ